MANRTFNKESNLLTYKRVVSLFPIVSVGGSGAVTLKKVQFTAAGSGSVAPASTLANAPTTGVGYAVGDGAGIRSITRNSAGDWTITLSDPYQRLIGAEISQLSNTGGTNSAAIGTVAVNTTTTNVQTNTAVGNGGVVRLVLMNGSTATDPASGDTVVLCLTLLDATEP